MPVRTHYDNLQIPQDADAETIRRAYRRLSKQYHPDLNQDEDAHRIMQLINQAYTVLSDPAKRAEHDRWIAAQTQTTPQFTVHIQTAAHTQRSQPFQAAAAANTPPKRNFTLWWLLGTTLLLGLLGWQVFQALSQRFAAQTPASVSVQPENPAHTTPASEAVAAATAPAPITETAPAVGYIRPYAAPNGNPWPNESGYIDGYVQTYGRGQRHLHVDNVRNPSDVFAELYQDKQPQPLRTFFIRARSYLILDKMDAGSYHIRYRQLNDGETVTSENIILQSGDKEATVYLQRGKPPKL